MGNIIVSLGGYSYWPKHNLTRNTPEFLKYLAVPQLASIQAKELGKNLMRWQAQLLRHVPATICSAVSCHYSHTFRAVSSVVERLVYTERVGGSKPSPPRFLSDR